MKDSAIFYVGRRNGLHIVESDDLPHFDNEPPLLAYAAALMEAGFEGVAVDQTRLANGRYFLALNVDAASPEGQMMQALHERHQAGLKRPLPEVVVQAVQIEYARRAKEASNA
jgi:hypothetical protein